MAPLTVNSGLKDAVFQAVSVNTLFVSGTHNIAAGSGGVGIINFKSGNVFGNDFTLLDTKVFKRADFTNISSIIFRYACKTDSSGAIRLYDAKTQSDIVNYGIINTEVITFENTLTLPNAEYQIELQAKNAYILSADIIVII